MAFIIRQSQEGESFISAEGVDNVGVCWVDGGSNYIPNQLVLVINGTDYPVTTPEFLGFGYFTAGVPAGIVLAAGDTVRLKSACSADISSVVTVLPIDLLLTTQNASTCNNTALIKATYKDRVRLFIPGDSDGLSVFKLTMGGVVMDRSAFFIQEGSLGNATSSGGDWTPDLIENTILFSNNLFTPTSNLSVEILDNTAYFTIKLGYIEVEFAGVTDSVQIVDYITGETDSTAITSFANGDIFTIESTISAYNVYKNGGVPVFTTAKLIDYILPMGAGAISPDPSTAGVDSVWTLPTTPADYPIQVKLGDKVTASAIATVSPCQLTADPKSFNAVKGSTDNLIPTLTGAAPNNCNVSSFRIKSLPACGTLKLGGVAVLDEQAIALVDISNLRIDIPANCPGTELSFTYSSISSLPGCQESAPAVITGTLSSGNAVDDANSTYKDVPVSGNVAGNDTSDCNGVISYALIPGSAVNGVVSNFNTSTGDYTFVPAAGYVGNGAQFRYSLLCNGVVLDTATVRITVNGAILNVDNEVTPVNTPINGTIEENDSFNCEEQITFAVKPGSELNGTVVAFNSVTGAYTFMPASNYTGIGGFWYEAFCGTTKVGETEVRITITPACDVCEELKIIKEYLKKMNCDIAAIKKNLALA